MGVNDLERHFLKICFFLGDALQKFVVTMAVTIFLMGVTLKFIHWMPDRVQRAKRENKNRVCYQIS